MKPAAMQSLARGLALSALLLAPQMTPAVAADGGAYLRTSANGGRVVTLGIGKSYVVDLPSNAAEVLVADPKVANAVVRSARKAYVIGIALGETDIIFFDTQGNQIESLAVSVARDVSSIRNNIQASMPDVSVNASAVGESVMLTGSVRSPAEAQTAVEIAANLVGSPEKVVNALAIQDRDQVLLKVSIIEMNRETAKQFGIRFSYTGTNGWGFGSNPPNPLGSPSQSFFKGVEGMPLSGKIVDGEFKPGVNFISDGNGIAKLATGSWGALLSNLEMLESKNLVHTLAEPNLTAISGEKAEFLAGGEVPIQVQTEDGISIEYKKFGVGLAFTPIVLANGRISLQLSTEVSENAGGTPPSFTVRRATTVVELPSGGSLALAGLLQDNTRQGFAGMPGVINLPVLGALFRSREYQRGQTELVVIVTPYLAKPNARNKLAKPDDGFVAASDSDGILLGRFNEIYAPGLKAEPGAYRGPIGHIVE
jgi:pilus assembly protein CpaC